MSRRLVLVAVAGAMALGAGGTAPRVTLTAPARAISGLPFTVTARVTPHPSDGVSVRATSGGQRFLVRARGSRGVYRATITLPAPGRWTLTARVGRSDRASRTVEAASPAIVHPFAVTVAGGAVFVADGANGRVVRFGSRGASVHASGLVEPTGLAPAPAAASMQRTSLPGPSAGFRGPGSVSALARLPQVTSVASAGSALYAVTLDGGLARISSRGGVVPIAVAGGLDRPHGIAVDRDGSLLIAEDSRRVRRIDPSTGRRDARRRECGHEQDRGCRRRHALPRRSHADGRHVAAARPERRLVDGDLGHARQRRRDSSRR